MTCPHCQREVSDQARFCAFCGSDLRVVGETRIESTAVVEETPATVEEAPTVEQTAPEVGISQLPPTRIEAVVPPVESTPPVQPQAPPVQPAPATPPPALAVQQQYQTDFSSSFSGGISAGLESVGDTWNRLGSTWARGAAVLLAAGLLCCLIGVIASSTSSLYGTSVYHGQTWASVGAVLALIAAAAAAAYPAHEPVRSADDDYRIAQILAGAAVGVALLGLIITFAASQSRAIVSAGAWASFASMCAFAALAWSLYTKPIPEETGIAFGTRFGGAALVLAVIALALGLGDTGASIVHSEGFLLLGTTSAVLALTGFLGRRSTG